jgi:hypothetical protein
MDKSSFWWCGIKRKHFDFSLGLFGSLDVDVGLSKIPWQERVEQDGEEAGGCGEG